MKDAREFLNSPPGKALSILAVLLFLGVLFFLGRANFRNDAASIAADRMYIDAKTGKAFEHTLKVGDVIPIEAPSGGRTGYPAELCYWTKDGKAKQDPTPVLLNSYTGKTGPTFCPDCGRLVVMHNPGPAVGVKPPPTQAEYASRPRGPARAAPDQGDGR